MKNMFPTKKKKAGAELSEGQDKQNVIAEVGAEKVVEVGVEVRRDF